MGRTHIRAFQAAQRAGLPCKLAAIVAENKADLNVDRGNIATTDETPLFDPTHTRVVPSLSTVLDDPTIGAVSVCTPTDTHVDISLKLLAAGKHVLIEKPVALASADVARLAAAAEASGKVCMPAMCMRFWPGWDWMKRAIEKDTYGHVLSATFTRIGSTPTWNREFYLNTSRSGGALYDLHVHDADVICWLFGQPVSVVATGSNMHVTALYRFAGGPERITAEGGWMTTPGFPFRMRYTVQFERAVADWDLSRTDKLLLTTTSGTTAVPLPDESAYDREVAAFILAIVHGGPAPVTLADALLVSRVLEGELASIAKRGCYRFA